MSRPVPTLARMKMVSPSAVNAAISVPFSGIGVDGSGAGDVVVVVVVVVMVEAGVQFFL